jgi:hypothetical protein
MTKTDEDVRLRHFHLVLVLGEGSTIHLKEVGMRSLQAIFGLVVAVSLIVVGGHRVAADSPGVAATNPWVRVAVDPPFGATCTAYWLQDISVADYQVWLVYEGPGGQVTGLVRRTNFGVYPAFKLNQVNVGNGTVTLYPTVNYPDSTVIYRGSYLPPFFKASPSADLEPLPDWPDVFSGRDMRELLRGFAMGWCEEAPQFQALAGFDK